MQASDFRSASASAPAGPEESPAAPRSASTSPHRALSACAQDTGGRAVLTPDLTPDLTPEPAAAAGNGVAASGAGEGPLCPLRAPLRPAPMVTPAPHNPSADEAREADPHLSSHCEEVSAALMTLVVDGEEVGSLDEAANSCSWQPSTRGSAAERSTAARRRRHWPRPTLCVAPPTCPCHAFMYLRSGCA